MDAFISFLRNMLLVVSGASESLREVPESELRLLREIAEGVPDLAVLNILRIMSNASSEVKRSNLPRVTLETAVMTASKLSSAFSLDRLPGVTGRLMDRERRVRSDKGETAVGDSEDQASEVDPEESGSEPLVGPDETPETHSAEEVSGEEDGSEATEPPEVPEAKSGEEEDEEDGDIDREKEKETSQQILGLFDAV
jgi:DNA polymerase III gamma/tau subunit